MNEIEIHACEVLQKTFCLLRHFAQAPLNNAGRLYLKLVADAAHNIPMALAGDAYHAPNLEKEVAALEAMTSEPYALIYERYAVTHVENIKRLGILPFGGKASLVLLTLLVMGLPAAFLLGKGQVQSSQIVNTTQPSFKGTTAELLLLHPIAIGQPCDTPGAVQYTANEGTLSCTGDRWVHSPKCMTEGQVMHDADGVILSCSAGKWTPPL